MAFILGSIYDEYPQKKLSFREFVYYYNLEYVQPKYPRNVKRDAWFRNVIEDTNITDYMPRSYMMKDGSEIFFNSDDEWVFQIHRKYNSLYYSTLEIGHILRYNYLMTTEQIDAYVKDKLSSHFGNDFYDAKGIIMNETISNTLNAIRKNNRQIPKFHRRNPF